jgi:hypothetical protein
MLKNFRLSKSAATGAAALLCFATIYLLVSSQCQRFKEQSKWGGVADLILDGSQDFIGDIWCDKKRLPTTTELSAEMRSKYKDVPPDWRLSCVAKSDGVEEIISGSHVGSRHFFIHMEMTQAGCPL